jgi:hypothetical protein
MKIFCNFINIILTMLFSCYLFAEENVIRFINIPWETSQEQVILSEGLPDTVNYDYDDNEEISQISSDIVWINSTYKNNDILWYVKNKNIPIGSDISKIINGHNKMHFWYYDILLFGFNSAVSLHFENGKLYNVMYIIETLDLTNSEKYDISIALQNYFLNYYGIPGYLYQYRTQNEYRWYLNDTAIMLEIFLPQCDAFYSEYNYVDLITVSYWYKKS